MKLWCIHHHAEHAGDRTLIRCWCAHYQTEMPFCASDCPHRQPEQQRGPEHGRGYDDGLNAAAPDYGQYRVEDMLDYIAGYTEGKRERAEEEAQCANT